jgi:hypothetical protein
MTMKLVFGALFLATTACGQSTQPANSRNIQVATNGVIIATSNATVKTLLFKEPDLPTITIGFPEGILSMDDISISDEGYLFGISVYTPVLCSFRIVTANLEPLGCVDAVDFSLNTYVGLSCKGGTCVVSGGSGGYTVVDYNRNNGVLVSELRCLNCQVNTMGNADLTNLNYVEVAMLDSRLASLSAVSDGTDTYSIVVDLNTNQLDTLHPIPDAVSVDLAVTPTNYPCVSDFYRSSTGEDFMITACGSLTIQSVLGSNSTVIVLPPVLNFVAVTVAVDKVRNVFVVGGHVMEVSYLAVWNIDPENPRLTSLDLAGAVEGTILSIGISRGRLAYMILESDVIQTNLISPSPSNAPSAGPAGAPSVSIAPSLSPSRTVSMPPTTLPTPMPVTGPPTSAGMSTAVFGTLLVAIAIGLVQL